VSAPLVIGMNLSESGNLMKHWNTITNTVFVIVTTLSHGSWVMGHGSWVMRDGAGSTHGGHPLPRLR
jgi:hypothetical protein